MFFCLPLGSERVWFFRSFEVAFGQAVLLVCEVFVFCASLYVSFFLFTVFWCVSVGPLVGLSSV